jgi:hypothetical protein
MYGATGQGWTREKQQIETGFARNFNRESAKDLEALRDQEGSGKYSRAARRMGGEALLKEQMAAARTTVEEEGKKAVEGLKMVIQNDLDLKLASNPQLKKEQYLFERFMNTNDTKERAAILEVTRQQGGPGSVKIGQMMEVVHAGNDKAQMAELDGRVAQMTDVDGRNTFAVEAAKRGIAESQVWDGSPESLKILKGIKTGTWATQQSVYIEQLKAKAATDPALQKIFNDVKAEIAINPGMKNSMKSDQLEAWGIV